MSDRLLPQEDVVAFVAAEMRGDDPLVEAYFAPDGEGVYPTHEELERSRCFYEYQFRMNEFSKPDKLGFGKALVYPVTQMVGMSLITYFVLNQIDYDAGFMDSDIDFLQGYFWEQLGEEISRSFEDAGTITWAWWTDYTATRYAVEGVDITADVALRWLSMEVLRNRIKNHDGPRGGSGPDDLLDLE